MLKLLLSIAALEAGLTQVPAAPRVSDPDYATEWVGRQPGAMSELESWIKSYPEAARQLFAWDRDHAPRCQFFLGWLVKHPSDAVERFATLHSDWPIAQGLMQSESVALEAFGEWAHAHAAAVEELAARSGALRWVGEAAFTEGRAAGPDGTNPAALLPTTPER